MRLTPTILATSALILIPVAIYFERADVKTWNSRLIMPNFAEEPNRHTPLQTDGTFLPPRLAKDLTLTSESNPIILTGRTEIPPGITVTFAAGTHLYAHEFSEISVFGTLRLQGTDPQPIILTTNEQHPVNQLWNGLIVNPGGRADVTHTNIQFASPALTCLNDSTANMQSSEITQALIGIFSESAHCISSNNRIQAIKQGVVTNFQ